MSVENRGSKADKQFAVSVAILEVIEQEGMIGVTHSKISRRAKVSRSWIYEYIGKERDTLIEYAAGVLSGYLARENLVDFPKTKEEIEEQARGGVDFLFSSIEPNPGLIKIYYRFRGTNNPIGAVIHKHETQWLKGATSVLQSVMGMKREHAVMLAELILTLRLGYAHRLVTSENPKAFRKRAEETFAYIHAAISGIT